MISIPLRADAGAVLAMLRTYSPRLLENMGKALDGQNLQTIGFIQQDYLRGQVLHRRTHRLATSLLPLPTKISGGGSSLAYITSGIHTNVVYAGIHEFGGVIHRTVKAGSVRLRTNARGDLLRNARGGAIFARGDHKRAKAVSYAGGKTYDIRMPERSYIRRGIRARVPAYTKALSDAIVLTNGSLS